MTIALPPITDNTPAANMQSSRRFLEHAVLELAKEPPERLQASEKGWGAISQAVKAVAKDRRWRSNAHRRTHAILNQIIYEQWGGTATATELHKDFLAVQALHTNYHENVSEVPNIQAGIQSAQRLVDWLEQVRQDGPRPSVIKDENVQARLAYLLEINHLDQEVIDQVIPLGKKSDDGFKKDGQLGRAVSRARAGKEQHGSYATSWGMPQPGNDEGGEDDNGGSNPPEDGRGNRPAPRPGGLSPAGSQASFALKSGQKELPNIAVKSGSAALPLSDSAVATSHRAGRRERHKHGKPWRDGQPTTVNIRM